MGKREEVERQGRRGRGRREEQMGLGWEFTLPHANWLTVKFNRFTVFKFVSVPHSLSFSPPSLSLSLYSADQLGLEASMRLLLLLLSRQVALILDFAANARRMSNTKNVYPRTPLHTHTHTECEANAIYMPSTGCTRLDSAQLPCLPWQRLRLSQPAVSFSF